MADTKRGNDSQKVKKPFNKKKWREMKYSNKAKVKRWDDKRRESAMRKYHKELRKEGLKSSDTPVLKSSRPVSAVKEAQLEYEALQKEKLAKIEEQNRIRKERNEAIKIYKQKKADKFRKLSQKTKRGQPVMKGRMELLLEKIEREYGQNK